MSYVLDVFVLGGSSFPNEMDRERTEPFVDRVNRFYGDDPPILRDISDDYHAYGGSKALQCVALVGAINYCNMERLGRALRLAYESLPQDDRSHLQICWKNEHDEGFQLVDLAPWGGPISARDRRTLLKGWSDPTPHEPQP